ncbi:MAG: hypothetical protein ACR2OZ_06010 [Verrucomicrobiales bacterium]
MDTPLTQIHLPTGHTVEAWNQAYGKVESFLAALRVRNKFLLGQYVYRILDRATRRAGREREKAPSELAMEEAVKVVNDWVGQVLKMDVADTPHRIATQGRLAMLLADVAGKWQELFLSPGPWPPEFVKAMRESYLRAGPDFQISQMKPRPIDLGPIHTLTTLSKRPYYRMMAIWTLFLAVLIYLFLQVH